MITVTDLSDNQFAVDVPLISSVFRRGPYTELKLGTGQTFYIQESVEYVMRLVFIERKYKR